MRELLEGVLGFHESVSREPGQRKTYTDLSGHQAPDTLFIGCSDSRVVPHLLSGSEPGDLFVCRNVGNLVPPSDPYGESTGDHSEAAVLEYAIGTLGVADLVVCGHSECGAMGALLDGAPAEAPNLGHWLAVAAGALDDRAFPATLGEGLAPRDRVSQRNVLVQLRNVRSYPVVAEALRGKRLRVHGWWFDIAGATVSAWSVEAGRFVKIDAAYAGKLLAAAGATAGP